MTTQAKSTYQLKKWDEKTWDGKSYQDVAGSKLTVAVVEKQYQGDLEGTGTMELFMFYREDGTAHFTGLERIEGKLAGRAGGFVLEHQGVFEDGLVKGSWTVVERSGSGELAGLRGSGSSEIGHLEEYPFELAYEFGTLPPFS
ncbi:MAG TPA: DUF3224 domain-containing protein [Aggregatilineaceae bacterium]|nr:DUF3224 domain-containing protein [Aggregatilineaceae bacterium]